MKSKKRISDNDLETIIQSQASDLKDYGSDEAMFQNLRTFFATENSKEKKKPKTNDADLSVTIQSKATKVSDADLDRIIQMNATELKDYGSDEQMFSNLKQHFSEKKTNFANDDQVKKPVGKKVFKPKLIALACLALVIVIAVPVLWVYFGGQDDYLYVEDVTKQDVSVSQLQQAVSNAIVLNLEGYIVAECVLFKDGEEEVGYYVTYSNLDGLVRMTVVLHSDYTSALNSKFELATDFVYKNVTVHEVDNQELETKFYKFSYEDTAIYLEIQRKARFIVSEVLGKIIK